MKYIFITLIAFFQPTRFQSGYDKALVEIKTVEVSGAPCDIVSLKRTGNHIKAKCFVARDQDGSSVIERFRRWSVGRNIVAYTSGTYTNACTGISTPIGLCIDQGHVVNENLTLSNLDALVLVYPNGGVISTNLKNGSLAITDSRGNRLTLDLRSNAYDKQVFMRWAQEMEVTVFQSHLLVYNDSMLINSNASARNSERRLLAVCKLQNNETAHYIINMPKPTTMFEATLNALKYLKNSGKIKNVASIINLDTGCQDAFTVYSPTGQEIKNSSFHGGSQQLSQAANLLVYYYE